MSFTAGLLAAHEQAWRKTARHEFIMRVADGTLEMAQFDAWLAQDYLYVSALNNYIGLLIARAPIELQTPLGQAVVVLCGELELFRREAEARGVELNVEPQPACHAYIQFLLATGWQEPLLPGLTVLWALERAYLDAWLTAREAPQGVAEKYRRFVENWTTPEFAAWVDWLASSVDALAAGASVAEQKRAGELFRAALRHEWLFWQMALDEPGWPV